MGIERPLLTKRHVEGAIGQPAVLSNQRIGLKTSLENRIFSQQSCARFGHLHDLDNLYSHPLLTRVSEPRDRSSPHGIDRPEGARLFPSSAGRERRFQDGFHDRVPEEGGGSFFVTSRF